MQRAAPSCSHHYSSLCAGVAAALFTIVAGACSSSPVIEPVVSRQTLAYSGVVRQQLDFSCSAAALATLLNSYYGERYTEIDLLRIARSRYDKAAWEKKKDVGLDFDDLIYMANQVGYEAEGAEIGLAGLLQINGPAIVHLNKGAFQHFSVYRGTAGGTILLADPITGRVSYNPAIFAGEYTNRALAVWKPGQDLPEDHLLKVGEAEAGIGGDQVRQAIFDRTEGLKAPM